MPAPSSRRTQSSSPGWGWGGARSALRAQTRRGDTWPKESDSGTIRNSRHPGASDSPRPLRVFWFPGDAGPRWAGLLGQRAGPPGGQSETQVWERQARGRLCAAPLLWAPPFSRSSSSSGSSACCPFAAPSPPPPLFRTISPLHSSFVSSPPLSLHPPLLPFFPLAGAEESGCAHLSDPNISTISSARRRPAPGSLPAPPPAGHCAPLDHTVRAP